MIGETRVSYLRIVGSKSDMTSYTLPSGWERTVKGWLSHLRLKGSSENTLKTRRSQIRSIARQSKTQHPREIDIHILITLCAKPGVSADYLHGQRVALKSFFAWCMDNDITQYNPAEKLPRVKAGKPRPRPTPDEVWNNLVTSAPPRALLMAALACQAGLRRAEIAGLHYDDLARDHNGWLLIIRGKGDKQRVVPIGIALAAHIKQHCQGGHVFPGQINGHMSPDSVGRILSRLMPKGWTAHKLRHRFATNGFNGTRNLLAVQQALGHSSVATTQRYTAITTDDVRAVSEAADQWCKLKLIAGKVLETT